MRHLPDDSVVLHPLPRNLEILPEVDADAARALYFEQAQYGIPVRMSLLQMLFGKL
jgi:aspartate carbamoyltransferase catalytic subunit